MKKYQLYIDGKWQDSQSGEWFESHDPYADEAWAERTESKRSMRFYKPRVSG